MGFALKSLLSLNDMGKATGPSPLRKNGFEFPYPTSLSFPGAVEKEWMMVGWSWPEAFTRKVPARRVLAMARQAVSLVAASNDARMARFSVEEVLFWSRNCFQLFAELMIV